MIFISLYNIIDSIDRGLEKNVKNYDNSFLDNFIDELKNSTNKNISENLSNNLFVLDRIEGNTAICENMGNGEIINIDKNLIEKNVKAGDVLKFQDDKYLIDVEKSLTRREEINKKAEKLWKN